MSKSSAEAKVRSSGPVSGIHLRPVARVTRWVVVESGARFDATARDASADETVVLPQFPGEPEGKMMGRIMQRLESRPQVGRETTRITFVVGAREGEQSRARRGTVAKSLIRHLLDAGGGELEVRPDDSCGADCRQELLALVETLLPLLRGAPVSVRVSFPEERRLRAHHVVRNQRWARPLVKPLHSPFAATG